MLVVRSLFPYSNLIIESDEENSIETEVGRPTFGVVIIYGKRLSNSVIGRMFQSAANIFSVGNTQLRVVKEDTIPLDTHQLLFYLILAQIFLQENKLPFQQ